MMVEHDQVPSVRIDDHATGLLDDQQRPCVVPHPVGVGAQIGEPVERSPSVYTARCTFAYDVA